MKEYLEETLRKRISDNKCLICARKYSEKKVKIGTTLFLHTIFGDVQICEKHIKDRGGE